MVRTFEQCCAWLGQVWVQAPVAEAISVASPALAARVLAMCSGQRPKARQVRRIVMRAVSGAAEQPLMVDLQLGCRVVLPPQVAAEAEAAAEALLRLTPYPAGNPAWRDYHARFLDRYGAAALVRLRDLIDPTTGLGFPAHYRGSGRPAITPACRGETSGSWCWRSRQLWMVSRKSCWTTPRSRA